MELIEIQGVDFTHAATQRADSGLKALDDVTLSIKQGDFVVVLGRNGSGKSTLARLFNALYLPTRGVVRIDGLDTRDENQLWNIRRMTGMVFSDPDNQIVGTTVEEDVAFGPENLGLSSAEITSRVGEALHAVGLVDCAERALHLLSGGEKQRLAIAGILAMQPQCIILDEATALLDPAGRAEVMSLIRRLNREEGITVIHITHQMEEAANADRILILAHGRVVLDGTPRQVFADNGRIKELGLDLPPVTVLFALLNQDGFDLPTGLLGNEEALAALNELFAGRGTDVDPAD